MTQKLSDDKDGVKRCFFIAPIGEDASAVRIGFDQILRHVVRPAAKECGYLAERADEIDKPGLITSQVIQRIITDPLVIADLTGTNPNVFYELAVRHAIKKPLVQIIEKGERIPFDVAGTRTIHVDHKDLDSVASAREQIVAQIKSLEINPDDLETPISVSVDLQSLRQSENPEDRELAVVISELSNVRSSITKLTEGIEDRDRAHVNAVMKHIDRRLEVLADPSRKIFAGRFFSRMSSRIIPELILESRHLGNKSFQLAIAASLFRDSAPWVYECGMEAYRQSLSADYQEAKAAAQQFRDAAKLTLHHPMFREFIMREKESAFILELLDDILFSKDIFFDIGVDSKR